jgi:polysaccharide export outer membrane protein
MRTAAICMLLVAAAALSCGQTESLPIGPGDLVEVQVLEAPELAQRARVTDAGDISLLLGGSVHVTGLTPAEASAEIVKALVNGHYMLHPHVNLLVEQYATQNVTISGQVVHPGSYATGTPRSLLDVLALAGGVTNLADRRITIEHHGTKQEVDYLLSNKSALALNNNPMVLPGDIVVVPTIDVVYVLGDVMKPGGYPMATNDGKLSLMEAIGLAGSQLPNAVPSSTHLIRKRPDGSYADMSINLSKMEKGEINDIQLQPDDIVYVPFSYLRNMGASLGGMITAAASATIYRY